MSSRIFQSVVLQMKDSTDRAVGVIDSEGTVVACNELTCIGEKWAGAVEVINGSDAETVKYSGNTFKPLAGWSSQFDYAAFARGEDELAQMVCAMAAVALNGAKAYYEEKHDKATFVNSMTVGGYETVLCGRMHFVGNDQRHGYEKRLVGDITPCFIGGDNEAFIYGGFKRSSGQNLISIKKSGAGHSAVLDYDEDVTKEACRYLTERTDGRPLFMTVGFYGPHCPYIAPEELFRYYYKHLPELQFPSREEKAMMHPAIREWYANRGMEKVTLSVFLR